MLFHDWSPFLVQDGFATLSSPKKRAESEVVRYFLCHLWHHHQQPLQPVSALAENVPHPHRFALPHDEDNVHGDGGENHGEPDGSLHGLGDHGQEGDDRGEEKVEDREEKVYFDRPLHVRALPTQVGQAKHRGSDGEPGGEADVVHEEDEVAGAEVAEAHEGEADDTRHWRRPLGVDGGEDPGHLALPRPAHEQPACSQESAVDPAKGRTSNKE